MALLESLLVGVIVLGCTMFSAWRLMSARWRLRVLDSMSGSPAVTRSALWSRLRGKALAELVGGCGACSQSGGPVSASARSANRKSA